MSKQLEGQVALVTGAGRGIGRAIGRALGAAGSFVVAAARSRTEIEAVEREIVAAGGRAMALSLDIAQENQVTAVFTQVRERLGRLDVLVNNAGIGRFGPLVDFAGADLKQLVAVNLLGTFWCCQQAMRLMIPQRRGYIINISSVVGFKGYPNQAAYTATKHAVMGLTKSLAVEGSSARHSGQRDPPRRRGHGPGRRRAAGFGSFDSDEAGGHRPGGDVPVVTV